MPINPDQNQQLLFSQSSVNLTNKIIEFLKNGKEIDFNNQELNKGLFIRCLIVALIKLEYIDAEQKVEQQEKNERTELGLRANLEEARKLRHHHIDDDNMFLLKLELKKQLESIPAEERKSTKLAPDEILSLKEQFQHILQSIKLIDEAQDLNHDGKLTGKRKPDKPDMH